METLKSRIITAQQLAAYAEWLCQGEKSAVTREKYLRDVGRFAAFAGDAPVTKERVVAYKQLLIERGYALRSINSMLASIASFLRFAGWEDCRVKALKMQRSVYCDETKELTRGEYLRLLEASRARPRLHLLLQTIGSTGIRVSELKYFTVEAVRRGEVRVSAKGKSRVILLPGKLKNKLLRYCQHRRITAGVIFRTRSGRPLDRSNIWTEMKRLCRVAGVAAGKVFPHNLRKLFARSFYDSSKDIAKLADLLGHSSIDTTRIYIITSGSEHRRQLELLDLVV